MCHEQTRQGLQQLRDDVALPRLAQALDPLDHERAQHRLECLHLIGRESLGHELPQGGVCGWVHHHDRRLEPEPLHLPVAEGQSLCGAEGLRVDRGVVHVLEAREHEVVLALTVVGHAMHGVEIAKGLVHAERIAPAVAAAGNEARWMLRGHRPSDPRDARYGPTAAQAGARPGRSGGASSERSITTTSRMSQGGTPAGETTVHLSAAAG